LTDQTTLTAAAARRRTFAATMNKGAASKASPAKGPAADLEKPKGTHYGSHAATLAHHAHAAGKPALASAITAVAHAPHPQDKMQVAQNYLATLPPEEAQQHAHMFTKQLMKQPEQ